MTVYVDDMKAEFQSRHAPGRRYVMSHRIADTDDELHAMADKIGVARKWFQRDHYDITQSKKALAIKHGCSSNHTARACLYGQQSARRLPDGDTGNRRSHCPGASREMFRAVNGKTTSR